MTNQQVLVSERERCFLEWQNFCARLLITHLMLPLVIYMVPMVYYSAIMSKKSQHVVPNLKGGWSVKSQGSDRAVKTFDTQSDAVSWARSKSRKEGLDLIVHGRDGTIRSSDSYGRDPTPPQQRNGRK